MFRADLHCHTTCSDGSYTPEEVIDLALAEGVSGLSITDHDTVAAYRRAIPYAKEKGLELIAGIELSAEHRGESVHILAYAFDLSREELHSFCRKHRKRRQERTNRILEKLKKKGLGVEVEMEKRDVVGRPHIAEAMIQAGYVKSVNEAFSLYLGDGRSCFTPSETFSVEETLDVIKKIGGLSVIAHPHLIRKKKTVSQLLKLPFDGLEGYYAIFPFSKERKWIDIAKEKGWIITGGSDFHGAPKPHIVIGASWVSEEVFRRIQTFGRESCGKIL